MTADTEPRRAKRPAKKHWRVRVFFEPRDAWLGVFWDRPTSYGDGGQPLVRHLKIYVCLFPCLPILLHRTEILDAR